MQNFFEFIGNHSLLAGIWVGLVLLLVITESRRAGRPLSAQAVINMINNSEAVVVDVRDEDEYKKGHIVNSINIPFSTFKDRSSELEKYKEKPVVIVCNIGQHSGPSGRILGSAGFGEVYRLSGGINGWKSDGLPLVKS